MAHTKGFTLIELIIVIALIALLATTIILVINPAKLLAEARDSQRIADLGQMHSALSIFLATGNATGNFLSNGVDSSGVNTCDSRCWTHSSGTGSTTTCGTRYPTTKGTTQSAVQTVGGGGWVPINLKAGGADAAIPAWPIDPKGNADSKLFYAYVCDKDSTAWEFSAKMESLRYSTTAAESVENKDGGNNDALFEVGTGISAL